MVNAISGEKRRPGRIGAGSQGQQKMFGAHKIMTETPGFIFRPLKPHVCQVLQ
jgi:hypothetical protein